MTNFALKGLMFSRQMMWTIWRDAAMMTRSPPTVQSSAWATSSDGLATNFRTWAHLFVSLLTLFVLSQNCVSSIKVGIYRWISGFLFIFILFKFFCGGVTFRLIEFSSLWPTFQMFLICVFDCNVAGVVHRLKLTVAFCREVLLPFWSSGTVTWTKVLLTATQSITLIVWTSVCPARPSHLVLTSGINT